MEPLKDKTGAEVQVTLDDHQGAFEVTLVSDTTVVGRTYFLDRDQDGASERVFYHTEVDEAFGGRGLAPLLIREAVGATRDAGLLVVPVCPLVRAFLAKNAGAYADAFRPARPEDIAWVQAQRA